MADDFMLELKRWRNSLPAWAKVVATNGCFDILHAGHVRYLQQAKALGDYLVVGLNSDESVRALKGETRPVNPAQDRAAVLLALQCVDAVTVFEGMTARDFLLVARPHVWVKGGDYTVERLDSDEKRAVHLAGGRIEILPLLEGRSTTKILERVKA